MKIRAFILLGFIASLLILICIQPVHAAPPPPPNIPELRMCIYEKAWTQIGVTEATGKNDGENVEAYLSSVGLGKGFAYCCAFVYWCYKQCALPQLYGIPKTGWCPAMVTPYTLIYQRGKGYRKTPQMSDMVFYWDYYNQRQGHIGLIENWNFSTYKGIQYVCTIEGNTNSNGGYEGLGVFRKIRTKESIYQVTNWLEWQQGYGNTWTK